jgi:hypothetical protein
MEKKLYQRIAINLYGEEVVQFHKMRQYEKDGMTLLRDITETVKERLFDK